MDDWDMATFPPGSSYGHYVLNIPIPSSGDHTLQMIGLDTAGFDAIVSPVVYLLVLNPGREMVADDVEPDLVHRVEPHWHGQGELRSRFLFAIDNGEGCAVDAILHAHVFVQDATKALGLLLNPDLCVAALHY